MESIIGPLIVAGMTGLAIIAYRHPDGYETLCWLLVGTVVLVAIGVVIWDVTASRAYLSVYDFIKDDGHDLAEKAIDGVTVMDSSMAPILFGGAVGYPIFLRMLKVLKSEENPVDPKSDGK